MELIGTVLEAISIIIASGTAVYGVHAWRREMIGRRRAELAEQALALFYEARDIIKAARNPFAYPNEGATRQRAPDESEDETRSKDAFFAPAERLLDRSEFFANLQASRYRFIAVFGEAAAEPFETVTQARNKVIIASKMLIRTFERREAVSPPRDPDRLRQRRERQERWESEIGWGLDDDDAVARDLDRAVEKIEEICRPVLSARELSRKLSVLKSLKWIGGYEPR